MSSRIEPADLPPGGLIDRVKRVALEPGLQWDWKTDVFVWRVYNDWSGVGAFADIDAVSGELLSIESPVPLRIELGGRRGNLDLVRLSRA